MPNLKTTPEERAALRLANRVRVFDAEPRPANDGTLERALDDLDTLAAEVGLYRGFLERAVKYAREDRMMTARSTRMARLLDEVERTLENAK